MTLTNDEEDQVRKRVIDKFGVDSVKQMDLHYMALNDIRMGCRDSYEFLEKVKEKYPDTNTELLLAAILYGMKQGELGYEYHLRQTKKDANDKPLPSWGSAS
jgi:DNA-binding NarL/FixJ family response regulator